MGTVHKFRRPPKNRGQFRGYRPAPTPGGPKKPKRKRSWGLMHSLLLLLGFAGMIALGKDVISSDFQGGEPFTCTSPQVTDGDTLRCGEQRVRLAGIDAPELPGHCREGRECTPGDPHASTASLRQLAGSGPLQCRKIDVDAYGRTVARCKKGDVDLSCAQLDAEQAVRRYGQISC